MARFSGPNKRTKWEPARWRGEDVLSEHPPQGDDAMTFSGKMTAALFAAAGLAGMAQAQAMGASDYVMKAGAGDQYEIQSSQLELQSSKDPKIKAFARKMIADHNKSTAMVKAAAMKASMNPAPPMLDADGQQMMSALQGADGAQRDALYLQQQKMSHDKALALHQDYSQNGDSAPLKAAAAKIVPVVQMHETMLGKISAPAM
jgi:putative membrane protein